MVVIDGGRTVEEGQVAEVFTAPRHSATRRLLAAAGAAVAR
jgi:ABC-type microcin C transport system duplicated ATPase subunit YejF